MFVPLHEDPEEHCLSSQLGALQQLGVLWLGESSLLAGLALVVGQVGPDEQGEAWGFQRAHPLGLVVEDRKDPENLGTSDLKASSVRDLSGFQSENRDYPGYP